MLLVRVLPLLPLCGGLHTWSASPSGAPGEHGGKETCGGRWTEFGPSNPLVSTQRASPTRRPRPFRKPVWHVVAVPPRRFAFCLISKNACSAWSKVLNKVVRNQSSLDVKDYQLDNHTTSLYGVRGQQQVFEDEGAVRAVMIRDPLARLLSAYLNKCFQNACRNPLCPTRGSHEAGRPVSFSRVVEWLLASDPRKVNRHWRLQSEHCHLRERIHEYNIIGYMTKETLAEDAACIMDRMGISAFNTADGTPGHPFWTPPKKRGPANAEEDLLKKFFTASAARRVIRHLRQDYETFNLPPEPKWVAEASGSLYDHVPGSCRQGSAAVSLLQVGAEADPEAGVDPTAEDDVVDLARAAGFI